MQRSYMHCNYRYYLVVPWLTLVYLPFIVLRYEAETRMLEMRRRLVQRGIKADRLQPEYCRQNSGHCYVAENNPRNAPPPTTTEEEEDQVPSSEPESEPEYGAGDDGQTAVAATILARTNLILLCLAVLTLLTCTVRT